MGKTNPFCLGLSVLGELSQEIQDIIRRDLIEIQVCKILIKLCNGKFVCPDGISFGMGTVIVQPNF